MNAIELVARLAVLLVAFVGVGAVASLVVAPLPLGAYLTLVLLVVAVLALVRTTIAETESLETPYW
jgi:hypothetical protein